MMIAGRPITTKMVVLTLAAAFVVLMVFAAFSMFPTMR
jgi:hypothetical protein